LVGIQYKKDSAFCFVCYLFRDLKCKGKGTDTFTKDSWRNWNIGEKELLKHAGPSAHNAAQERYSGFVNPKATIDYQIERWSDEDLHLYKIRLTYSFRCLKFLLHQGLAFCGHDESEESSVERVFSTMSSVKNKLRNKIGGILLDDCLVTYIERDIFFGVDEEAIIQTFMALKKRRLCNNL
jgi:hypothetical protein